MSRRPGKDREGAPRQGFTTGSAAAAAAKAAVTLLMTGETPGRVDIPLPPGARPEAVWGPRAQEGPAPGAGRPESGEGMRGACHVDPHCEGRGDEIARDGRASANRRFRYRAAEDAARLNIPVEWVVLEDGSARAAVVKDAGDDPDATNGARIFCVARLEPSEACQGKLGEPGLGTGGEPSPVDGRGALPVAVFIEGGRGVGRVTLPGLPVPVGRAAINPAPLAQIESAAREALPPGWAGTVKLLVEVENGEELARRTLNPRLGVAGGISILGTQGVVKPYSLDAWRATIDSGLTVARAAGLATAAFSTGRRSERLLMANRPDLPELAFVQAADFFAWSIRRAVELGFTEIVWGCFFGKLAKMAQGLEYTHAHAGDTDFGLLADLALRAGADEVVRDAVTRANTARHALELVPAGQVRFRFARLVLDRALDAARTFAGPGPRLGVCCFGFDEGPLCEGYTS